MNDTVRPCTPGPGSSPRSRRRASSLEEAGEQALAYLRGHVPEPGQVPLCGNSIGVDRRFLDRQLPELDAYLHYRSIDVSSLKELCRRWYPEVYKGRPGKRETPPGARRRPRVDRRARLLPRHDAAARRGARSLEQVAQRPEQRGHRCGRAPNGRSARSARPSRRTRRARRRPRCRSVSSSSLRSSASSTPSGSQTDGELGQPVALRGEQGRTRARGSACLEPGADAAVAGPDRVEALVEHRAERGVQRLDHRDGRGVVVRVRAPPDVVARGAPRSRYQDCGGARAVRTALAARAEKRERRRGRAATPRHFWVPE